MEESGATILASLPIGPREQAKAKVFLMLTIQTLSFLIAPLILALITGAWILLPLILATLPVSWASLLLIFELKVRLFGKMKYKYVLEEIYRKNKVLKWVLIVGVQIGVIFIYFSIVITLILFSIYLWVISLILLSMGIFNTLILWFVFNKMFPKPDEMADYKTGGALRESPLLSIIVLTALYGVFLFLPDLISTLILLPLLVIIPTLPFIVLIFIDFGVSFGMLGLLWLYVVPFGMKLPFKKQEFGDYLENIGLGKRQSIMKNIGIGLFSFVIFSAISLIGGVLLGIYKFVPEIIFGTPTYGNFGWFIFIIMLIPGIWEEFSFRGVMIPNLGRKYSKWGTILISGIAFGLAHSMNFIIVLAGGNIFNVLIQIIYATTLGFAFGYMFVRTESLIPCIVLHYLIDSLGQLFLYVVFPNWVSLILYLLLFIAVIPICIIIFIKLITKDKESNLSNLSKT
jgi:membrane protease YdiL (CAAX protease family)